MVNKALITSPSPSIVFIGPVQLLSIPLLPLSRVLVISLISDVR